jgi:hypothetical protein
MRALWMKMDNQWRVKWTLEFVRNKMQSTYELVQAMPLRARTILDNVSEALHPRDSKWPSVVKDLEAFQDFLAVMNSKLLRATTALLSKPRVEAYLKGEEVEPDAEEAAKQVEFQKLLARARECLALAAIVDEAEAEDGK